MQHTADLVRMVNQMADFFEPYPKDEALKGIAGHIDLFWEPRMQAQLFAHLDQGGDGLSPLALEGARMLQATDNQGAGTSAPGKN